MGEKNTDSSGAAPADTGSDAGLEAVVKSPPERDYIAFDLEIARDIPPGTEDWHTLAPLGITVAVAGAKDQTIVYQNIDPTTGRMSKQQCCELVGRLQQLVLAGYTIVTWNGLMFDFDVLATESGMVEECAALAMNHVDMMFHFFCLRGFPVSLDAVAQGMGTTRKTEGMHGDLAPQMWLDGKYQEVIAYTNQDVRATLDLAYACERRWSVHWVTKTGYRRQQALLGGWLTVSEALKLPLPDNSWMTNPWKRERFTAWMERRT